MCVLMYVHTGTYRTYMYICMCMHACSHTDAFLTWDMKSRQKGFKIPKTRFRRVKNLQAKNILPKSRTAFFGWLKIRSKNKIFFDRKNGSGSAYHKVASFIGYKYTFTIIR
jgi:hypothetical protein